MRYRLNHKGITTIAIILLLCIFLSVMLASQSTYYFLLQNSIQDAANQKYADTLSHTCMLIATHDVLVETLPPYYPASIVFDSTACSIDSISVNGARIEIKTGAHYGRSQSNLTTYALLTPGSTTPITFENTNE